MKALVIGSDSMIGRRLAPALRSAGWQVHGTTRRSADGGDLLRLDLADPQCVAVRLPPVDIAFFCAAITRFSDCDADPALARQVNVLSPVALAERLVAAGTHAILLSSIAVYDGKEPRVPAERQVNPNSLYGRLKADAEQAFLALGGAASIVRFTKVLAPEMPLFNGWIDALANGLPVSAFEDTGLAPVSIEAAVESWFALPPMRAAASIRPRRATTSPMPRLPSTSHSDWVHRRLWSTPIWVQRAAFRPSSCVGSLRSIRHTSTG